MESQLFMVPQLLNGLISCSIKIQRRLPASSQLYLRKPLYENFATFSQPLPTSQQPRQQPRQNQPQAPKKSPVKPPHMANKPKPPAVNSSAPAVGDAAMAIQATAEIQGWCLSGRNYFITFVKVKTGIFLSYCLS